MQIAPIGAVEVALANLATSAATQQQLVGTAAQQGNGTAAALQEKQPAAKVKKPEQLGASALTAQEPSSQPVQTAAASVLDRGDTLAPSQGVTERQLFDYLAEIEKSGAAHMSDPSALLGRAMHSVDGTMQLVQKVMDDARGVIASKTAAPADADATAAGKTEAGADKHALGGKSADELLEQSISVMWAASNLQVVVGSVTAATSSASTLIKQQ